MAQFPGLTLPPSGGNQKATVIQGIGPVKVTIEYSSPSVKDRRGKIWGGLVPYGLNKSDFGDGKLVPWRTGANETTVFAVSHDVLIDGKPLAAGRYGLFMIAGPEEWTVIFSKNSESWGNYHYDVKDDALRVVVKPKKHEYREWLTFEFVARKSQEAAVELQWEDLAVGWTVSVPNLNDIIVSSLKKELQREAGFTWQGYVAAVEFCVQQKVHLDQALIWADAAIGLPWIGQKNLVTLSAKASVLAEMGKTGEAVVTMKAAAEMPGGSPFEIHQVGRQLLGIKQPKAALEVFQLNQKHNGDAWPVNVGLARGFAANGDKATALIHARKALEQAPDENNKRALTELVKELSGN
jgi:hypothetical protein